LCSGTPGCDIRDVATVLRWVDADNGAAWLQMLAAGQKDRDTTEVDRILADMAHAARFDFYWNRIVVLMVDALEAARDQPAGQPSPGRIRQGWPPSAESPAARSFRPSRRWWKPAVNRTLPRSGGICV